MVTSNPDDNLEEAVNDDDDDEIYDCIELANGVGNKINNFLIGCL